MDHTFDEITRKINKSEDKLIDIEAQIQANKNTLQELMQKVSRSEDIEIGKQVQAKDHTVQEITQKMDRSDDKLAEIELYVKAKEKTLQEIMRNITISQDKLIEIENQVNAKDNTVEYKKSSEETIIKLVKQIQTMDNTIQEMMWNFTRSEYHLQTEHQELATNLNQLQAEMENIREIQIKMVPTSCKEVPRISSGSYTINLGQGQLKTVFCEQVAYDGGWIVFQYRYNGKVDFYRSWAEYRDGFGTLDGEFWMGLKYLHQLTSAQKHELIVEMKDYNGSSAYAKYDHFEVGTEAQNFALKIGNYNGTAGDSLNYNQGMEFSTEDRDNDNHRSLHCAEYHKGPWWHNVCTFANLNGPYENVTASDKAMFWHDFKNDKRAMVYTTMMLRPIN
ncbi:hypothetical protein ZHAS_00018381 [Anopheles sinensis]|uniref:Fibrinogen C-terminal domain-containing protein n=1 Tax=Anopheles sinensis TaxID=74873 RepID=A0A084WHN4_ANOSI|nr:hypothetical protein ZHAS_00018381 [Anopheles sinensis]